MKAEMPSYTSPCGAVLPLRGGGEYMEHPAYRDNLEQILNYTGGRQLLTVTDVRKFTGLVDQRTIKRRYPFVDGRISAATLARCMCGSIKK